MHFFVTAGALVAGFSKANFRAVLVATVPSRSFCSSFAALGSMFGHAPCLDRLDTRGHFQMLSTLQTGTGLTYTRENRRYPAVFAGLKEIYGVSYVRVLVQATARDRTGGATFLVPEQDCLNVAVSESGPVQLGISCKGRKLSRFARFTSAFYSDSGFPLFAHTRRKNETLVVGKINNLRDEMTGEAVGFQSGKSILDGCLQAILQVRKFASSGDSGSVDVIAGATLSRRSKTEPRTLVFDDALSYLKFHDQFQDAGMLVILDRTDPHFVEAVSQANGAYLARSSELELSALARLPSGIELMAHAEKSQC